MASNLLIFIPQTLCTENSGYVLGKVIHDTCSDLKKFYIISLRKTDPIELTKSTLDVIGYHSNKNEAIDEFLEHKHANWIHIVTKLSEDGQDKEYRLLKIILNNKKIDLSAMRTMIVLYNQWALQETELFESKTTSGDHFYELAKLVQSKKDELKIKSRFVRIWETLLTYHMSFYLHLVLFLSKVTDRLLPILKYSSLGLHIHDWLENVKWMLATIMRNRGIKLKTGNYVLAIVIDMALGIFVLQLLKYYIKDQPSQLLLNNAEKVVESLKELINWLMGVPAGLKLNHALNNTMGKFFLYHIQLWWTFLIFLKPLLDLAFEVLLLFGRLGITFQISIVADLLALVSFHTYCIYVYAARLFNIQLRGITALFRLFLGKKKNPLRERVDSCLYQTDQLFVGTLSFTILLFLMPTTWVYYTVFTLLRLVSIAFGGFLTRLKFYLQVMPVYTFWRWLLRSDCTCSIVDIRLHPSCTQVTVLSMTMVVAPWRLTWKKCIPDTIICHPSIEWCTILNNVIWGHLLYPL
ncbi:PREDICTED: phosphatidylinositol N-acetylglucosaminyltransferase subunit Q isoform X2 [Trachymyrmex cornetzi]|uniref:phosphatidylinositol N-acetylglucosaminyltransferase subunit Q isoform X2 n=1 Tax=Trachymyrmex cornetzi TaxID=471704 RepID=UPI00084F2C60|nr:PREDICTED: phosphatidylinositol N-acetylglucosaminyltransferase subunit Q isoform X2 [Trachymyrmex cornetzi]